MFAVAVRGADHFVCKWRGLPLHQLPAFLKPYTRAKTHKHHVITMFAVRDDCADHFVCKWGGGCAPPSMT